MGPILSIYSLDGIHKENTSFLEECRNEINDSMGSEEYDNGINYTANCIGRKDIALTFYSYGEEGNYLKAVSYTHLTLPTIYSV